MTRAVICALAALAVIVWMAVYLLPYGADLFSPENVSAAFRAFIYR